MKHIKNIFILCFAIAFINAQQNSNWETIGNPEEEFHGNVYALAVNSVGDVIVGGDIHSIGDLTVPNIARWDGSQWNLFDDGLNGIVKDIVIGPNGHIYACGWFSGTGGEPLKHIAKWTGQRWKGLGGGLNSGVMDIAFDKNGNLYAAGWFTKAGNINANRIAKWDGSTWSALGSGLTGNGDGTLVRALEFDKDGNLYAGGVFKQAGGVSVNSFAKWDGSSWSSIGGGIEGVSTIKCDTSGNIYIAGTYKINVHTQKKKVMKWDGSSWSRLGNYFYNEVYTLEVDKEQNVYVGTYINSGHGSSFPLLAKWNGSQWIEPEGGVDQKGVIKLLFDGKSRLYAGGYFSKGGDKVSPRVTSLILYPSDVNFSNGNDLHLAIEKGKNDQIIGRFALNTVTPTPYLTHLNVSIKGIYKGINTFKLWESKHDTLNVDHDKLLAEFNANNLTNDDIISFSDFKSLLDTNDTYYYISCDANDNASGNFSLSIADNSDLGICGGTIPVNIENERLSQNELAFPADLILHILDTTDSTALQFGWSETSTDSFDIDMDQYYQPDSSENLMAYFSTNGKNLAVDYRKTPHIYKFMIWEVKTETDTSKMPITIKWDPTSLPTVGRFFIVSYTDEYLNYDQIDMNEINQYSFSDTSGKVSFFIAYSIFNANFKTDITQGYHPLTVQFTDLSEGNINAWYWNFGDGETSFEQNPSHTYRRAGCYSVSLHINDDMHSGSCVKRNLIKVTNAEHPIIYDITDVPDDQGGWVYVNFSASIYDTNSPVQQIESSSSEMYTVEIYSENGWVTANSTLAYAKNSYSVLVHTPVDLSIGFDGQLFFRVVAGMNEGTFISPSKSGYSVDNIAPPLVSGVQSLLASNSIELSWNESSAQDLGHYNVYRSMDENFEIENTSVHTITTNASYRDTTVEKSKTYYYRITAVDIHDNESEASEIAGIYVSVENIPFDYVLSQNFPNPFNPSTTIKYGLPETTDIKLEIFSIDGYRVNNWNINQQKAGWHTISWNGRDISGNLLPTGLYIYKLQTSSFVQTKKMILMK